MGAVLTVGWCDFRNSTSTHLFDLRFPLRVFISNYEKIHIQSHLNYLHHYCFWVSSHHGTASWSKDIATLDCRSQSRLIARKNTREAWLFKYFHSTVFLRDSLVIRERSGRKDVKMQGSRGSRQSSCRMYRISCNMKGEYNKDLLEKISSSV